MDVLKRLQAWLTTFPKWEEGKLMYLDFTDGVPGNQGLFPQGQEVLQRKEDVLGNISLSCRYHFALYRVTAGQEDQQENARWLMEFQDWVQQQDAMGLAPKFGDVPEKSHIRAEKGRLSGRKQAGSAMYVVMLTADFTKLYEVN